MDGHQFQYALPGTNVVLTFDREVPPLIQYLSVYRDYDRFAAQNPTLPTKHWFFRKNVELLWGPQNKAFEFKWHPWAEQMNEHAHKWQYLGLIGCASSGKSDWAACYGLVNWLADPANTLVLITSTSIKGAQQRIWAAITRLWQAVGGDKVLPGKLLDSTGTIRTRGDDGNYIAANSGLQIVAGEPKKAKESLGKLIGIKAKHIIFILDELPELSPSLVEAFIANLTKNPNAQIIGLGNLGSIYTPLGDFVTPEAGWGSITVNDTEWKTTKGYCLRFDGLKSPNVLAGQDIYPFLYRAKNLAEDNKNMGQNSASFWRMVRSFPPPVGADFTIYSEADILAGNCYDRIKWIVPPTKLAALDPGYTQGGDRSIAIIGEWGETVDHLMTLQVSKVEHLFEDTSNRKEQRNHQIAQKFVDLCVKEGVSPKYAALDGTGAGIVFHEIVCEKWGSTDVLDVQFGGAPSDIPCFVNNNKTAKDAFDRKVSELWWMGIEFMRGQQIRGLTHEIANELCARKYELRKGATVKVVVERKSDMKERIGFSPDAGDAWACLLFLARARCGAVPVAPTMSLGKPRMSFFNRAAQIDQIFEDTYAGNEIGEES